MFIALVFQLIPRSSGAQGALAWAGLHAAPNGAEITI